MPPPTDPTVPPAAPRRAVALAAAVGLVVGTGLGAGTVTLLGTDGGNGDGCTDRAADSGTAGRAGAVDGYAYHPALVVALGHAIAAGHPDLEDLASAVHRAEADAGAVGGPGAGAPAGSRGGAPGAAGAGDGPPGDVAIDYLTALATLAARPDLATDDVLAALDQAATGSPDLNDIAAVDGERARGAVAVSALLRRSEAYSPDTEPPELTELIDAVAAGERAARRAGMHPTKEGECAAG